MSVTEPTTLDEQLCFPLYAASRLMTRAYTEALAATGLTYPQYLVLLVLWEDEPVTMLELGPRLRLDSGTLTPLLKRLQATGLVERSRDPADERRVVLRLTDDGRALRGRLAGVPERVRAACGLGDVEIAELKVGLESLLASLERHLAT